MFMEQESSDSINVHLKKPMDNIEPGDFSFLKNDNYSKIYEYDYNVIHQFGEIAWYALRTWDNGTPQWLKTHS